MQKIKTLVVIVLLLVMVASFLAIASYRMGYRKGTIGASVERVPFDLSVYLMMYEMSTFIYSNEMSEAKTSWRPVNVRMLLYSTMKLYEHSGRALKEKERESIHFAENLKRTRSIISEIEVIDVGSVVDQAIRDSSISEP